MRIRSVIYLVTAVVIGALFVANWGLLSETASLNLLLARIQAPLVVLPFLCAVLILLAGAVTLALNARAWSIERRRLASELEVARARADKEEESRTQALRTNVEHEFAAIRTQLDRLLAGQSALLGRPPTLPGAEAPDSPEGIEPELIPPRAPVRGRH